MNTRIRNARAATRGPRIPGWRFRWRRQQLRIVPELPAGDYGPPQSARGNVEHGRPFRRCRGKATGWCLRSANSLMGAASGGQGAAMVLAAGRLNQTGLVRHPYLRFVSSTHPNTTLPIACQWAAPRRRFPVALASMRRTWPFRAPGHSMDRALGRNSSWRCPGRFSTRPLDLAANPN